jgi:hypothetical protein
MRLYWHNSIAHVSFPAGWPVAYNDRGDGAVEA